MAKFKTMVNPTVASSLGNVIARNVQSKQPTSSRGTSAPRSSNRIGGTQQVNPRERMPQDYGQSQYNMPSIDELAEARRQALINSYERQFEQSRADIEAMRPQIAQRYAQERTAAAVSGQQEQRRLGESLAARGVTSSGEGREAAAQQFAATQGRLGDLSTAEQNALTQLDKQLADLTRQKDAAIAQGLSEIDISTLQQQINQANADRQFILQEAGLTGMYRGQETMAGKQFRSQQEMAEAGLTGIYKGQQTMAGKQSEIAIQNAEIQNQIAQLQLEALPDKIKNESALIQQQLQQGQIGIDQAKFQLNQLQNPNSVYNQLQKLELEAKRLGNVALTKQIAQIGRRPPVDPLDQRAKQLRIQAMEMELEQAKGQAGIDTSKWDKGLDTYLGRLGDLTTNQEIKSETIKYIRNLNESGMIDDRQAESMLLKNGIKPIKSGGGKQQTTGALGTLLKALGGR